MTGYAASPNAGLPRTPSTSGSSWNLLKFLKGPLRFAETFLIACRAASEYERRVAATNPAHAGDVAREVYKKYFDGR